MLHAPPGDHDEIDRLEALLRAYASGAGGRVRLLTVDAVADFLDVDQDWVYERTDALGALRLGPGKGAPIRFEPRTLAVGLVALRAADVQPSRRAVPAGRRGKAPAAKPEGLLPIRGRVSSSRRAA